MKVVISLLTVIALQLISLSSSFSAEQGIGLREAVLIALKNNHALKAQASGLAASASDIGIARSSLLPMVSIEEKYLRTVNPTYAFMAKLNQERFSAQDFAINSLNNPDPINDFQTLFSIEQPIFARQANIGLEMVKKGFEAASSQFQRSREEMALQVVRAFLAVRTSREYVGVAEKGAEDATEHVRLSELRYKNGLGLYSDTLRAKTALTGAEQQLVSARKNQDVAKKALGLLLGGSEAVEANEETVELPFHDLDHYAAASQDRQDVKALAAQHENARKSLALANAAYLPTLGIGGSYQLNDHNAPLGSEGDSWLVAAVLRWQLYDGSKREYERVKAGHRIAETGEYLEGLKKAVSFEVYDSFRSVEEKAKNLELAKSSLATAEEGQRLVQMRYENSLSPLVDLLDAQVALDHARANVVASHNDHELAKAALSFESGTILPDLEVAGE